MFERLAFIQAENIQGQLFQCQSHMFQIKGHGCLKIQLYVVVGEYVHFQNTIVLALSKAKNWLRQSFQSQHYIFKVKGQEFICHVAQPHLAMSMSIFKVRAV